ncbi:MAG: response regulator [Acidobacteria bacterium]|nr:response regulator [Acidobacteriota bacterium]
MVSSASPSTGDRVDILIVEDSPTQAQRLQHILEQQGYRVTCAANGRLALDAAHQRKPALVISDVVMPEMDGYEVCRRLKADSSLSDVPVILVTTLSDPGDVIRGLECGADNFIFKPYEEHDLLNRVKFVLLNRGMRQVEQGGPAVDIFFNGRQHFITADRRQILSLLLSTYDAAIQRNRELACAQVELDRFFTLSLDMFCIAGMDGYFKRLNSAFGATLGYSTEEMLARPFLDFVHPDDRAATIAEMQKLGQGQVTINFDNRYRCKDGSWRWLSWKTYPFPSEGLLYATAHDITEQKAGEQALAAAKLEAERASHAKSEFLSRMSHDLRTPLNAILGFAQLLELDTLSAEHLESIRYIRRGGAHLLSLINEVLDIARIESGHLSLSPEPVAIGDIIQHVVELVRPLAAQRGIVFEDDAVTVCGSRHLMADRQRLTQILLNLLSNAVKYNRDGGRVRLTCENVSGGRLRIKVSDTGAGIRPEKLELLFQPFERLGAEQTGIEGTGLGLVLSKGLSEAMGGTLGVESEVDRGSTFWVELALAEPAAEAAASSVRVRADASSQDSGVTGTVLYVEDNISNRRLMERVLSRRPTVRLVGVAQGQAGLDIARADRPDLILLDLHLPDMHGEEVLRRLWEDPQTRAIPVAVLSADATPAQARRLRAAGATAYLTKPLDVSQVLQLLDDTLTRGAPPQ